MRHALVIAGAFGCASFGFAPAREAASSGAASSNHADKVAIPAGSETAQLRRAQLPGPYPAEILHIVDGDTFEARVRIWFGQEITTLVRIRGIDAPELKGLCGDELRGAAASRGALEGLLNVGVVTLRDVSLDKYGGRVVASVAVAGSSDVAAAMIASGWARPYNGGRREAWCPLASRAKG